MNEKQTLHILICDDERNVLGILQGAVIATFQAKNYPVEVKITDNTKEFLQLLPVFPADLLLLDVDMPDMDGIQFAKELHEKNYQIPVIFVSSREDRVFDSFQVHPFGFVRKSNFSNDFSAVVDSFLLRYQSLEEGKDYIVIQSGGQELTLKMKELIYIEGQLKYQLLYIAGRKDPLRIRSTMDHLEELLSSKGFLRIHKGFLVNITYIRLIGDGDVILTNDSHLPVSKRKVVEIRKQYLRKMQETNQVLVIKR